MGFMASRGAESLRSLNNLCESAQAGMKYSLQPCIVHRQCDRVMGMPFYLQQKMGKRKQLRASLLRPSREQAKKDQVTASNLDAPTVIFPKRQSNSNGLMNHIQTAVIGCRFFTFMGVAGSLTGSVLCFVNGCFLVLGCFGEYLNAFWQGRDYGQIILLLVEAIDVYLVGTVMLIFGIGLYEIFINRLVVPMGSTHGSSLFGCFPLKQRPQWLEIHTIAELKTKVGHVIVMLLLIGSFDQSKRVPISTGLDMLCFSTSILVISASIFLLSRLSRK